MGHIKRSALAESEVVVPPKNTLAIKTQLMQPIVDQLILNKIETRKLAALRDSLLPKLMSGEIDVSKVNLAQLNSHLPMGWCVLLQIQSIPTYLPQLQLLSRKHVLEP